MWAEIGPIRRDVGSSSPVWLEPWRGGGKERERGERHAREERDRGDVPPKSPAVDEPEHPGDHVRRQEVAHVHEPGHVVVPVHLRRPVPEPILQPDRGNGATEEKGIRVELRPIPGREEQTVGVSPQQVVDREHERERQPLEDHAAQPAHEIGRREREETEDDPEEQPLASHRYALAPHVRTERGDVESRRDPADQPR